MKECLAFCRDCRHWYAIRTATGYEKKLISTIHHHCGKEIELYHPVKEMIHRIKGEKYISERSFFPGYIFVYKHVGEVMDTLRNSDTKILSKPVMANGKYLEADQNQMKFLFDITGKDGVIKISKGIVSRGDSIRIIDGPLKDFKGEIIFINKRQSRAKVRIEIMDQILDVSLGLEIFYRELPPEQPDTISEPDLQAQ